MVLYLVYATGTMCSFSARADKFSERASDSSGSAGDNGKDYRGFLREHVRLYPKFFAHGVCLGVKDLKVKDGCFL